MGLQEQVDLATNGAWRDKLTMAMVVAATNIAAEDPASTTPEKRTKRQQLALEVLTSPTARVESFAWAVAANPVMSLESPDGDLQYTVNSVWDDISGASTV